MKFVDVVCITLLVLILGMFLFSCYEAAGEVSYKQQCEALGGKVDRKQRLVGKMVVTDVSCIVEH